MHTHTQLQLMFTLVQIAQHTHKFVHFSTLVTKVAGRAHVSLSRLTEECVAANGNGSRTGGHSRGCQGGPSLILQNTHGTSPLF